MDTAGVFAPRSTAEARDQFESVAQAAETVTKEIAEAGTESTEAYERLVDPTVVETAQQALFASLLEVHTGTREAYEHWLDSHDVTETSMAGTETVPHRAWHPVWPESAVFAVSYQDRPEAAIATLRRQAFGQRYRALLGLE